jgi:hypothetical protein
MAVGFTISASPRHPRSRITRRLPFARFFQAASMIVLLIFTGSSVSTVIAIAGLPPFQTAQSHGVTNRTMTGHGMRG